jgi:hypothetical protein
MKKAIITGIIGPQEKQYGLRLILRICVASSLLARNVVNVVTECDFVPPLVYITNITSVRIQISISFFASCRETSTGAIFIEEDWLPI